MLKNRTKLYISSNSPAEITVPCGDIFVCQTSSNIKHDDCTLPMNTENQEKKQIMKCQTGQEPRCHNTVHQTISARRIGQSLFKQGENGDAMTQRHIHTQEK